ncbi:hypothetical protein BpHYR1_015516 [Brachionus plicatilis]|uniref:Uncharacterized protein n=1 Tax=Brachionus plicatilis TaxID=10195 RepID=A0A3M7RTS0_BRAPC|nr:hypothetical protein BpHYR1_015516 [Brachionus plicatilis]
MYNKLHFAKSPTAMKLSLFTFCIKGYFTIFYSEVRLSIIIITLHKWKNRLFFRKIAAQKINKRNFFFPTILLAVITKNEETAAAAKFFSLL